MIVVTIKLDFFLPVSWIQSNLIYCCSDQFWIIHSEKCLKVDTRLFLKCLTHVFDFFHIHPGITLHHPFQILWLSDHFQTSLHRSVLRNNEDTRIHVFFHPWQVHSKYSFYTSSKPLLSCCSPLQFLTEVEIRFFHLGSDGNLYRISLIAPGPNRSLAYQ